MLRPTGIGLIATAALCLCAAPAALGEGFDQKGTYDACIGNNAVGCRHALDASSPAGVLALFDDRKRNGTRYTLAITGAAKRTYRRRTTSSEGYTQTSIVNLNALGRGRYTARWKVGGKVVATWRFQIR